MRLDRLHLIGFGRFVDRRFDLAPGFNLVYGDNEAGKSTLLSFIELMLYGAKRDGVARRLYLEEYELYRPWSGAPYEGRIVFTLDEGRKVEIFRRFDKDREALSVHDPDLGKDIGDKFPSDRRGEILFARELLGLSRSAFLNSVMVRQLSLSAGFKDTGDLSAALLRSLSGGGHDSGAAIALDLLGKALEKVGKTDRGKRAGALVAKLNVLGKEKKEAVESRLGLGARKERFKKLEVELLGAREERESLRRSLAAGKAQAIAEQLAMARHLQEKIDSHRQSLDQYKQFSGFPHEFRDNVQKQEERRTACESDLQKLSEREEAVNGELQELDESLKELSLFRKLPPKTGEEMVELKTRWRQAVANLKTLKSQIDSDLARGQEKLNRLEELSGLFKALGEDAVSRVEDLVGEEEEVSEEMLRLSNRAGRAFWLKGPYHALSLGAAILGAGCAVGAVLLAVLDWMGVVNAGFAVPMLAGIAAVFAFGGYLLKSRRQRLDGESDSVSQQYEELLRRRKKLREERRVIFSLAGAKNVKELLKLQAELYQMQESIGDDSGMLQQRRLPQLEEEVRGLESRLLSILGAVGVALSVRELSESAIRIFLDNFAEVQELQERRRVRAEQQQSHRSERRELQREMSGIIRRLDEIYEKADVRGFTEFLEKAEGKRWFLHHQARLERHRETLEGLLAGRSVEALSRELAEARELASSVSEEQIPMDEAAFSRLQEELREVESRIFEARGERDQLSGIIETMQASQRDPGMVELDMERYRDELERIRKRRSALVLAREEIEEATEKLHADFAPSLNEKIGAIASRITSGRYGEVMMGDEFQLSVRSPENAAIVHSRSLSGGAMDQLVFAARLAIADALAGGRESLPLLLDDSLVEYDAERAREALRLLVDTSTSRQVVLFSCHSRELELAREMFKESFNLISLEV